VYFFNSRQINLWIFIYFGKVHNLFLRKAKERVRIYNLKKPAVNSTALNVIAKCLPFALFSKR